MDSFDNIAHFPVFLASVEIIIMLLVGLALGSFATAAVYRIPRNITIISGRSKCTKCKAPLSIIDLIPFFSWLFSGGKCRHCKKSISSKYPLIELTMTLLTVMLYWRFGISEKSVILLFLSLCLLIMAAIDFEHYILPDSLNLSVFILGLTYVFFEQGLNWQWMLLHPLFGFGIGMLLRWIMWVWKKKEGLGMGDVKFFAAAALWLPLFELPFFFFLSGVIGIVVGVLWRIAGMGERFPFGPALVMSLWICIVFPFLNDLWIRLVSDIFAL